VVDQWCAARRVARGAVLSLDQIWRLSQRWYTGRQNPGWRRMTADEMSALFDRLGLTGDFWKLG